MRHIRLIPSMECIIGRDISAGSFLLFIRFDHQSTAARSNHDIAGTRRMRRFPSDEPLQYSHRKHQKSEHARPRLEPRPIPGHQTALHRPNDSTRMYTAK